MSDPAEKALARIRAESPELTDEQAALLGQRRGAAPGVPADLEAMLPPVPDPVDEEVRKSEPEHLPDEPVTINVCASCEKVIDPRVPHHCEAFDGDLVETVIRPCKVCGESLDGEHPRRKTCKRCQTAKQKVVSTAFNEKKAAEPPKRRILPDLVIVEGQTTAVDGLVIALYKYLKHELGLSKNGISEVIDGIREGSPPSYAVEVALELEGILREVPFGTLVENRVQICRALTQCWGQDVSGQWRVF